MAKPTRKEREKLMRRQHIIDAARKVFAAKGFNRATMEEIAEKAEYSPAALYSYFQNKYELYTSLHLDLLNRMVEGVEGLLERDDLDPVQKIRATADILFDIYLADPVAMENMCRAQGAEGLREMSPEMVSELNGLSARALQTAAKIIDQGIRQGLIEPSYNPIALADALWAQFTGLVLWEESKKYWDQRKDFFKPTLDMSFEIFVKGIMRR
jgi:AcrR family transcriptional regulator